MNKKTFYITTPIYYPSGDLHIGHLYTTTIAWVLKNYKQKLGYDTKLLTGSDEHGQKIEQKAKEYKMSNQEYVDMQSQKFIDLWKVYSIDYDFFSRTTSDNHIKTIKEIFSIMYKKGIIYKGKYQGLYSVSDEEFIPLSQAIKKDGKFFHPTSNHELTVVEEESYFFKMTNFSQWLNDYVNSNPNFIKPSKIWNELKNNFIDKNLEDLSITRISFEWGVKINEDPKHVIYVWLDALFNYISALDYLPNSEGKNYIKYWKNGDEIVHVVGKEIARFHCIYWPIFLHSLNIKQPTKILAHGWIVTPEGKMSKSKGNVINPLELIEEFDPEVVKYFLIAKLPIKNDGVFSKELLNDFYNSDVVNTIGNLVSRTIAMINKNFNSPVKFSKQNIEEDNNVLLAIENKFNSFKESMDDFEIDLAFNEIIELAKHLNKYIDLTTPWLLTENKPRLEVILNILLNGIYAVLAMLEIVMPNNVAKFKAILNVSDFSFENILNFDKFNKVSVNNNQIIFARKK